MAIYQTDSCRNSMNNRRPTQIYSERPQWIIKITRQGKSIIYPTIGNMYGYDYLLQIITLNWTDKRIHSFMIPFTTSTLLPQEQLSDLETTISELLVKGVINEKYVVDLFTQEALFESKKTELESKYQGKEIVVCGGEIFVGDDVDKLIDEANHKYQNRPFYSHSFKHQYSTF